MNIKKWYQKLINRDDYPEVKEGQAGSDLDRYKNGVSVITPSYKGKKYILKLLESMKNQTLSYDLFEHIIVINGELDSTPGIIEDFKEKNPEMNIKVLFSDVANASHARNLGIKEAERKYSTLIDDDDFISPSYLEELYRNASPESIVMAGFYDIDEESGEIKPSYITPEVEKNSGKIINPYKKLVGALTINVIKLIPTDKLKQVEYNTTLKSGLDVAFYSRLYALHKFQFYVVDKKRKAIYYRLYRKDSLSRRPVSYQFNVLERLLVIKDLNESISIAEDDATKRFLMGKVRAQSLFIKKYLDKNPDDTARVLREVKGFNLDYFPYQIITEGKAKKLVISYNFPPYVSTSGNNMAKRVNEMGEIVDVVQNQVRRAMDEKLNLLVDGYIDEKILIDAPYTFGGWNGIKEFCQKGMKNIEKIVRKKGEYEEVYSRAMFPASHFLAFEYKIKHPKVKWTAEFSDPLLYDIKGNIRGENTPASNVDQFMNRVNSLLAEKGFPKSKEKNLFFLCEYLPYVFADELVFTNENQKEYMIKTFPYPEVTDTVRKKAVVHAHSIPRKELYSLEECNYPLDENHIHLAYFGTFYETRNMDDVFIALFSLNKVYREKCKIHFFTSDPDGFRETINCIPVKENIKVNPYVNFLEFLNLTTKFDCLIVNDAITRGYKDTNPYLPSKLSDYLGSGSDVWILYEEDSAMSKYEVKYRSRLNDFHSVRTTLEQIIQDKIKDKNAPQKDEVISEGK